MHLMIRAMIFSLIFPITLSARAQGIGASVPFTLNQSVQTIELEKKDYETVYRTDLVPDTCYRSETQGYRPECHTEYHRQCHTELNQQCGFRSYPVCNTVPRTVCTPRQVCRRGLLLESLSESLAVNTTGGPGRPRPGAAGPRPGAAGPRPGSGGGSGGGTTGGYGGGGHGGGSGRPPSTICHTETSCQTVYDRVCRNVQRYECWSHPQTFCQDIPRQACIQVPNVVQVPYSCMKPVQVAVGQNLKLQTNARITVYFDSFDETGPLQDNLTARLEGNEIRLSVASEQVLYQVANQSFREQRISETARILEVEIHIRAITTEKLNAFSSVELRNGRIFADRIEFSLSRLPGVPFRGHLRLTRHRALANALTIVDSVFDPSALSNATEGPGDSFLLPLRTFGAGPLKEKRHTAGIRLTLDGDALRKGAVNPSILSGIRNLPVEATFETSL
jgi:hypothetical protein